MGNALFDASALSYFSGLGVVGFVGAGSAVLGMSPLSLSSALAFANEPALYVIEVSNPVPPLLPPAAPGGLY